MDGFFNIETELKRAAQSLNGEVLKQMDKCLQTLTMTGNPSLDPADLKQFKRFCRESDDYVRYAFLLIMKQLKKNHAEVRLSAFQVADELFCRSHAFREILVIHLQTFLSLTTETEANKPLPPPKPAANKLKADSLRAIQRWYEKYGQGYRKLAHGYDYLRNCKHIDFVDIRAQNEAERRRAELEEQKKEKIRTEKLAKVLKEIKESRSEVESCCSEAESCLKILLPTPSEFFLDLPEDAGARCTTTTSAHENMEKKADHENTNSTGCSSLSAGCSSLSAGCSSLSAGCSSLSAGCSRPSTDDRDDDGEDSEDDDLQLHGVTNPGYSITLELPAPGSLDIRETADNTDVMSCLRDASKLVSSNFLPKVTRWLEILTKNGASQADITSAIDLKVRLENIHLKCVDLKLVTLRGDRTKEEDSDEEDFEEVPVKEGFEPHIPSHLRAEYGLAGPSQTQSSGASFSNTTPPPGSSTTTSPQPGSSTTTSPQPGSSATTSPPKVARRNGGWNLKEKLSSEHTSDPTSLAAAVARVRSNSSETVPSGSSKLEQEKTTAEVPVVEFGADLAYWENPEEMEAPSIIKYDSLHRFWRPHEPETEKPSQHDLAAVRNRVFAFPGKFVPVKWKCRAPMSNGRLCERMDRVKCPFHGKIIARDEEGKPSNERDLSDTVGDSLKTEETSAQEAEVPPWQDPELQREIEHATGHDLGSARSQKLLDKSSKGKGKRKGKNSNLTNLNETKNTTRRRLEDKVFNKRSLKRVCSSMDTSDYKRVRDKFANQFNYSLN